MPDQGQRFSQIYLERGAPARDSQRFRNRLASYYHEHFHERLGEKTRKAIEQEIGANVPWFANIGYWVADLFKTGELRDVLDTITIVYRQAKAAGMMTPAHRWLMFAGYAMREENVGYRVDENCVVHYFVDQEFERNRVSVLAVLDSPRYTAVKTAFEDAYGHLDRDPRDTKAAVRSIFESLEILVRLIAPETKNLNKWIVQNTVKERCVAVGNGDATESTVSKGMFSSLAEWVDAVHYYRHGQATEEPVAPSEEMAIHILSTGSAYIRWLCQFDAVLARGDQ